MTRRRRCASAAACGNTSSSRRARCAAPAEEAVVERLGRWLSNLVYGFVALSLASLALTFVVVSIGRILHELISGQSNINSLLDAVGMSTLALAVFDVAKYVYDEEIMRSRELHSPSEARKTLTKILTIVIIAVSLEGLLFIFQYGKKDVTMVPYAAVLLLCVAVLLAVLGFYQRLSRETEQKMPEEP